MNSPTAPKSVGSAVGVGRWSVDAPASTARFSVRDKMFGHTRGHLPVVRGVFDVGADGSVTGTLTLSAAGVDTGNAKRDAHLATPTFFDAQRYPEIDVRLASAAPTEVGWDGTVVLTVRDRSATVNVTASIVECDDARGTLAITGRLDRTPLAMRVPAFVVGRYLDLVVELSVRRERR